MGKQPYIPIYIGDWEQDTNCISLEAEAALLKLVFKLWKSKDKGLLTISFSQIALLFKKSEDLAVKILQELKENEVLNIEFLTEKRIKIESRRMLKDVAISKVKSENGSKGGRSKKQTKSKPKAKVKLITEYDNDNDTEIIIEYLNKKASVNFQKTADKNITPIHARLKEKFTMQDFQDVIDHKVSTWGVDLKMKEYLRPETLFGTKFEGYLQAARSPKPNNSIQNKLNANQAVKNLYPDEPSNI